MSSSRGITEVPYHIHYEAWGNETTTKKGKKKTKLVLNKTLSFKVPYDKEEDDNCFDGSTDFDEFVSRALGESAASNNFTEIKFHVSGSTYASQKNPFTITKSAHFNTLFEHYKKAGKQTTAVIVVVALLEDESGDEDDEDEVPRKKRKKVVVDPETQAEAQFVAQWTMLVREKHKCVQKCGGLLYACFVMGDKHLTLDAYLIKLWAKERFKTHVVLQDLGQPLDNDDDYSTTLEKLPNLADFDRSKAVAPGTGAGQPHLAAGAAAAGPALPNMHFHFPGNFPIAANGAAAPAPLPPLPPSSPHRGTSIQDFQYWITTEFDGADFDLDEDDFDTWFAAFRSLRPRLSDLKGEQDGGILRAEWIAAGIPAGHIRLLKEVRELYLEAKRTGWGE
ncbi:hypothetical protein P7C70_g8969, partial [Phenoliferia sp. Uapishka_3]